MRLAGSRAGSSCFRKIAPAAPAAAAAAAKGDLCAAKASITLKKKGRQTRSGVYTPHGRHPALPTTRRPAQRSGPRLAAEAPGES
ncbi:hypothetical protein, conserved [Eimeria tenella]|uniref:Uncharacterized protein n=1 Tax=Eimeria tenella TaxID=5802 RepID=U6KGG5_EIMTE|nr:hypothetical protein, conserved [Eimeria tenella]CDJ37140.1 hypothetical protein, conserved [Eimeria tenella]|eukprot:XP_013227978.1 hypothetical protein, conserved [Eimeria tenella]